MDENIKSDDKMKIVLFGRGFVVATKEKDIDETTKPGWWQLRKAVTIRSWGTSHGIGELAVKGPLKDTVLDALPFGIEFPVAAISAVVPIGTKEATEGMLSEAEKAAVKLL